MGEKARMAMRKNEERGAERRKRMSKVKDV
jgi:hypothetical protein